MKKRAITAALSIAMLAFLISCTQAEPEVLPPDNPQQGENPPDNPTPPDNPPPVEEVNFGYCDFGPVTQYGGGCFKMESADDCDLQWGKVVEYCPGSQPPSSSSKPSSSSTKPSGNSSNSNNATGGVECTGYCKWDTGCVRISTDPIGEYGTKISTCSAAIENCQKYSPSKQVFSNDACSGGTATPSSSASSGGTATSGCSINSGATKGSFTDSRDGKSYKSVKIGTQTWMAENLNYNASGSLCYDNSEANCSKYGRLYDWATAMDIDAKYNKEKWGGSDVKHKGICPTGWHLPSDAEWTTLTNFVGSPAGTKLKATSGWAEGGNGTDDCGFSALAGGSMYYSGLQLNNGSTTLDGYWWSSSVDGDDYPYMRTMTYDYEFVYRFYLDKPHMLSIRCVQN
ncbi:hypothetical protein R83H12_01801 [Fibrobacteria bacterium R8-3-H12]